MVSHTKNHSYLAISTDTYLMCFTDFFFCRLEGNDFTQNEHLGTHMDAPRHFVKYGQTIDDIKLEKIHGPGKTIFCSW